MHYYQKWSQASTCKTNSDRCAHAHAALSKSRFPFATFHHRARLPDAHAGRLVPRRGQHRPAFTGSRMSRTAGLSLMARAHSSSRVVERCQDSSTIQFVECLNAPCGQKKGKWRCHPRRCAARVGERFLAVRLPGWEVRPGPEPSRQICALRGSDKSSPRRFRSAGTVPRRAAADSTFFARSIRCRTSLHRLRGMLSLIPTVTNCRDSRGEIRALKGGTMQRPRRCAPRAARTGVGLPVLADRARAPRGKGKQGRETSSGPK